MPRGGVVEPALLNWTEENRRGRPKGADSGKAVSAEEMEIRRLRANLVRVMMERNILGRATAYFAKGQK